jgi:hypothetical protein
LTTRREPEGFRGQTLSKDIYGSELAGPEQ